MCIILKPLNLGQEVIRNAKNEAVPVIQPRYYGGIHYMFNSSPIKMFPYFTNAI